MASRPPRAASEVRIPPYGAGDTQASDIPLGTVELLRGFHLAIELYSLRREFVSGIAPEEDEDQTNKRRGVVEPASHSPMRPCFLALV